MITSYSRGHEIEYFNNEWVYSDNKISINKEDRCCIRCGEAPTKEGSDACIGFIDGAISACCGHGKENAYVIKK